MAGDLLEQSGIVCIKFKKVLGSFDCIMIKTPGFPLFLIESIKRVPVVRRPQIRKKNFVCPRQKIWFGTVQVVLLMQ